MNADERATARARCEAATPGPWHGPHDEYGCVHIGDYGWVTSGPNNPEYDVDSEQGKADAEFIAHARTDLEAALAMLDAIEAEIVTWTGFSTHERNKIRAILDGQT